MNEADTTDRLVLPQWLPSVRALQSREAGVHKHKEREIDYARSFEVFNELLLGFREDPSPYAASDLMGVAVVLNEKDIAKEIAGYVVSDPRVGQVAQSQARVILANSPNVFSTDDHASIKDSKIRLSSFPRDAFAWIDQARLYTIIGQYNKAKRAINAALHLSPADRIIVRSAIRFFAHHDEWDAALYHAEKAYRIKNDPLILGLIVSIGTQLKKLPVKLKPIAQTALASSDMFLYSEVLAALGTFEIINGAEQRSKRFFKRAWADPSKPVVSQSQWVIRNHLPSFTREQSINFYQSAEAMSWLRFAVLDFKSAVIRANDWILEEPYSRSAHLHGSHSAVLLDDYVAAEAIAKRGLQANPGDLTMLNNLAFAQLRRGDATGASSTFEPLLAGLEERSDIAETATFGLLLMSQGNMLDGSAHYQKAINMAIEKGSLNTAVRASLHYMISTLDLAKTMDLNVLQQSTKVLSSVTDPGCIGTAMSLAKRLEKIHFEGAELKEAAQEFWSVVKEAELRLATSAFGTLVDELTTKCEN